MRSNQSGTLRKMTVWFLHPWIKRALQLTILTVLLNACGESPVGMSEMSDKIASTLTETSAAEVVGARVAVNLGAGFAPAVRAAVETNEGYRAALALEDEAMGRIGVAQSARRPQWSGNANLGGIQETGGSAPDKTTKGVAGGMTLSQLLYDGGETVAGVNQATAEALAARAERQVKGNDLAMQSARAWIDVWQVQERLALLAKSTSEMNELVMQIDRMATSGMIDRAALSGARGEIIDIRLEEVRLQSDLHEAQVRFERYFNQAVGTVARPGEVVTLAEVRAAAQAWQQSPGLQRSAAEVLIARSAVTVAQAAFRPRAHLKTGLTSPMDAGESTDTSVGIAVEYTFGDGGRRRSQLDAANARVVATEAQLTDAQRSLQAEMDAALTQLSSIERSMPLLEERMRLSGVEADTARSQISTGQSSLRQLIGAEIATYRACDRHIMLLAERHFLLLSIAAMTGALEQEIGLDHSAPR